MTPLGPTNATFTAGANSGSLIALITGLQDGETITGVTPNDGRLAIAGSGTQLVVGLSASSAGNISAVLTSSTGRTLNMAITVAADTSFRLDADAVLVDMGDSLRADGKEGTNALLTNDTMNTGGTEIAKGIWPGFRYDLYPRDTSAIEVGFGAPEYTWGANLGLASSTLEYHYQTAQRIIAMFASLPKGKKAVYWGPTINSVRVLIATEN